MKHWKNNRELDKIIIKNELIEHYVRIEYWDDDEWLNINGHHCWCDCEICSSNYEYLPEESKFVEYINKRGVITQYSYSPSRMIDMNSIYSKEVLRQKRINHILGIENMNYSKITIGDILNYKK